MIPYARQHLDADDIAAVEGVLRGDWLTGGPVVAEFEAAVADRVGARHAVAVSSGTAALHAAAAVAGLGPGDLLATPSLTFAASANCARYVGADVEFIDIEDSSLNMDLSRIADRHTAAMVVHFAGLVADCATVSVRPRWLIEDAAHALGAIGPSGPVGGCAESDMCVFSFHPTKSITTGEGGMITTNSDELASALQRFRNHGMDRRNPADPWAYEIADEGFNYRLSAIHAALGLSQLDKLDGFLDRRESLAQRYDELLADLDVRCPPGPPGGERHARHLYPIRVADRSGVYRSLHEQGIGAQVHYTPVHEQPRFRGAGHAGMAVTDRVGAEILSLPLFVDLTDGEQDQVVDALRSALR